MNVSFLPNNVFPLPAPIVPKLVALGLDDKTAATVSKVYLSAARSLKETCETEYIRACSAFIATSDIRGHSSKQLRSKLLTVTIARYTQALSKWAEEAVQKAEASLRRKKIPSPLITVKNTTLHKPSCKGGFEPPFKQECLPAAKPCPFHTTTPPHAFPNAYPPSARPSPITFVTHIPLSGRRSKRETKAVSDGDLDACIAAFAGLSLGPSPPSRSPCKPSKATHNPRLRTHATSKSKPTSQLLPSLPRLVSPVLDTSVAVSDGPLPKSASSHSPPTGVSRTQNVDIPRSSRRKVCSIPYRRPAIHPSTSPESPPSPHLPHGICRTPSLVSDCGSEASSPSTPPDFPSMPVPTSTPSHKDPFLETISPLETFIVPHSEWQDIDFGTNLYG